MEAPPLMHWIEEVVSYLKQVEREGFYGMVGLHLQGGQLNHVEIRRTLKRGQLQPTTGEGKEDGRRVD